MFAIGTTMAADKFTPRNKVAPEGSVPPEGDDRDYHEAIRAIMELFNVDEATAREMWERFNDDMQTEAANS